MKRILTIIVLAAACTSAFAQKAPQSSSYSELKNYYNASDYVKSDVDPYSLFWIGLESLGAPGTGQLIMKETGRGWAFLGASVALGATQSIFAQNVVDLIEKDANGKWVIPDANKDKARNYLAAVGGVMVAQLGLRIWSCIDAVKIAKVKNQYYQDTKGKHAFSATVYPSVDLAQTGTSVVPTAGMTFAVRF